MAFSAADVKNLREMTGAGMMDCKKALTASDGDMDGAIKFLREKGLAAAAKKATRIAAEGMVVTAVSEDKSAAAIVEVNSETDFVAKNEKFVVFAENIAKLVLEKDPADVDALKALTYPGSELDVAAIVEVNSETDFVAKNEKFVTFAENIAKLVLEKDPADVDALKALPYPGSELDVAAMLNEMVLTIGENIQIRRFARLAGGTIETYIHMGGKVGVIAQFELEGICPCNEDYKEASHDVCMQVAATNPQYVCSCCIPESVLAEEKEIQLNKAREENSKAAKPKPEAVIEKMIAGRINKFYEEVCLLQQKFVKDDSISVEKMLQNVSAKAGGKISLKNFVRYEKGEGIEKKKDDLAAEVAAMTQK
ncbi:MAG: translation elongation factor Ts [Clostridia bacterium]|nr:translation elongation factor Ts [Clostridia bacterium]